MKTNILLIEKRTGQPTFVSGLTRKGFTVEAAGNGNEALALLDQNIPHLVLVNAASMRTSGRRICQAIRQRAKGLPMVLVVEENNGDLDKEYADVVLTLPFTLQKLLNRIRPLLPAEGKDILQVGPLKLDIEQRWVRSGEKQISLTPRLVTLLKSLMDRPGEVVDRAELFRMVWETEYIGDTRTLDVHISWLRQAIEENPRHPQFIKTIRGVGYRLDVESFFPPAKQRKK
jgi:DNA-binding response OmpR family regulator